VQGARAVLLSSNPALAYQSHLNQVRALIASTSAEDAEARLDAIYFLAYDPITDSAALRRVEESLTNRMFSLSAPSEADTLAEATTFIYVNGIDNVFDEASRTQARLDSLIREVPLFQRKAFEAKLFYNRTFAAEVAETPQMRTAKCVEMFQRRKQFIGRISQAQFLFACSLESIPTWSDQDKVEALLQFIDVVRNSPARDLDARVLADSLQLHRARGRHIFLVPHSQGNMMTRQAIRDLRETYNYSEQHDSTCVGVLSLAAPTSANWQLPPGRLIGMVLHRDYVADWGFNEFPRLDNEVSRSTRAEMDSLALLADTEGWQAYYNQRIQSLGLLIHKATSYLVPSESRAVIKTDLDSLYHRCAAKTVLLTAPGKDHPVGDVFEMTASIKNSDFEDLHGRRIAWSSSNPAIASIDTSGSVRALNIGAVTITGRSGTAKGNVALNIHEPSPYPPGVTVFGAWRRTRPDGNGGSCQETLQIDASASLRGVCDDGSIPDTDFGVAVNAPWIRGKLAPAGATSVRWEIALDGDGDTLNAVYTRFPNDPAPITLPSFTRP
jgi:hypothetical protein